eukprot:3468687-Pyramimonas_sp.AAC.1
MAKCHQTHCDAYGKDFALSAKQWAPNLAPTDPVPLGLGPRRPFSPCRDNARPRSRAPRAIPLSSDMLQESISPSDMKCCWCPMAQAKLM